MSNTPCVLPATPKIEKCVAEAMSVTVAKPALFNTISLLLAEPPVMVPVCVAPIETTSCPVPPTKDSPPAPAKVTVTTPEAPVASTAAVAARWLRSAVKLPAPVMVAVFAEVALMLENARLTPSLKVNAVAAAASRTMALDAAVAAVTTTAVACASMTVVVASPSKVRFNVRVPALA